MEKTQDLIKQAEKIQKDCSICSVSSIDENGYPKISIMMSIKNKGIKIFYFSTGASSAKTKHYKINSKSGVTFWKDNDSITLVGKMQIVKDKKIKDALWQEWMKEHFSNGGKNDPEYTILKFTAIKGTFWINNVFKTLKI